MKQKRERTRYICVRWCALTEKINLHNWFCKSINFNCGFMFVSKQTKNVCVLSTLHTISFPSCMHIFFWSFHFQCIVALLSDDCTKLIFTFFLVHLVIFDVVLTIMSCCLIFCLRCSGVWCVNWIRAKIHTYSIWWYKWRCAFYAMLINVSC